MKKKVLMSIKTDPKLKKEAQKLAKNLGLSLSAVINNYLRNFVDKRSAVFSDPLIPNEKTAIELRKALEDYKAGKNMSPVFDNVDEFIDYLNSQ